VFLPKQQDIVYIIIFRGSRNVKKEGEKELEENPFFSSCLTTYD
jgi:hypothetical protein